LAEGMGSVYAEGRAIAPLSSYAQLAAAPQPCVVQPAAAASYTPPTGATVACTAQRHSSDGDGAPVRSVHGHQEGALELRHQRGAFTPASSATALAPDDEEMASPPPDDEEMAPPPPDDEEMAGARCGGNVSVRREDPFSGNAVASLSSPPKPPALSLPRPKPFGLSPPPPVACRHGRLSDVRGPSLAQRNRQLLDSRSLPPRRPRQPEEERRREVAFADSDTFSPLGDTLFTFTQAV